jgi:hypothetical protein
MKPQGEGEHVFVALELIDRENGGLWQKLRARLVRPTMWLDAGECLGGRYAVLHIETSGGKIDWEAVERICGSYAAKLLLPENLEPPTDGRLRRLSLRRFGEQVLLKTACELVARTKMPMYRRVLGLVDPAGNHASLLPGLLRHYTSVKVLTEETQWYRDISDQMMEDLGAPVLLAEDFGSFRDCVLVVAPSAVYTDREAALPCPILCGDAFVAAGRFARISGLQATVRESVRECCPRGIRPHDFAGALYECCGADTSDFLPESLLYDYRLTDMAEAVAAVARLAGLESPFYKSRT